MVHVAKVPAEQSMWTAVGDETLLKPNCGEIEIGWSGIQWVAKWAKRKKVQLCQMTQFEKKSVPDIGRYLN